MNRKIDHTLFILNSDSKGGMAKYALKLVGELKRAGLDVEMIFLNDLIDLHNARRAFVQRCSTFLKNQIVIYKTLKKMELTNVVAFQSGVVRLALIPAKILRLRIMVSERSGPSIYRLTRARQSRFLTWILYALCDRITIQFPSYAQGYPSFLRDKIRAIPNFVEQHSHVAAARLRLDFTFVFLGRFSFEKNLDIIIDAFILIADRNPEVRLRLIGEGPLAGEIQKRIQSQELSNRISIEPYMDDTCDVFLNAEALICVSKWEGFPNAVAEALAHDMPILGWSNCEGVRDLVKSDVNGYLIQGKLNASLLAEGMKDVMHWRLTTFKPGCCRDSILKYSIPQVISEWISALRELEGKSVAN